MQLIHPVDHDHASTGTWRDPRPHPGGAEPGERPHRETPLSPVWLLLLLAPSLLVTLRLPGISASDPVRGLRVTLLLVLAQLPAASLVVAQVRRRRADQRAVLGEIHDLGLRTAAAESAVCRGRERSDEIRATIRSITVVHRLLRERGSELPASTRARLERLHETELARLQRILTDRHAQSAGPLEVAAVVEPYLDSLRSRGHRARRLAPDRGGALRLREDAAHGATSVPSHPAAPSTSSEGELCLALSG